MLPIPTKYTLTAGSSEGEKPLTAFDQALLAAGVGNLNLLKVSSILPPGAVLTDRISIPPGALTPVAYGAITSSTPGELIAAAVAVGVSRDSYGVIMEYSGYCSEETANQIVREMVVEAMRVRKLELIKLLSRSVEHKVDRIGSAFAGVVLWW